MHRRVYVKERCRGGFRKVEITNHGAGWNVHCHELVDADWISLWRCWDIEHQEGKWSVRTKHPGLAVLFTECCQKYEELKADGQRWGGFPVFSRNNPASWFIVDVREVTYSPENEISKYIAKGNQIVEAGATAVLDYLVAIKGKQLFKGFSHCYGVKLDEVDEDDKLEEPPMKGCCPYDNCPMPDHAEWEFQRRGFPDAAKWHVENNASTGTYRIIPVGVRK